MKITIITDGNNKLGMGHIYQSMTLAGLLSEKTNNTAEILFITKSDKNIIKLIEKTGYPVYQYSNDDLIFEALENEAPDRIIFDKLDVSPNLARKIKNELKIKLLIFTNLTEANKFADVTLLADIGSNFKNIYRKDKITGKVEFFGPKYWILRPEFYTYKEKQKVKNEKVKNIMMIFGGSDPSNLSSLVLNELLQIDKAFDLLLVLGSAYAHFKELDIVRRKNTTSLSKLEIVKNINTVAKVMYDSDVVLASPGLSFFEALSIGTPVIGFHQDELQKETYKELLPTVDKNEISKLPSILERKSFIFPSDPLVVSMEIGEGKDEIIHEILKR